MASEPPKVDFCIRCGEYLRPGISYCPKCGSSIATGAPAPGQAARASASKNPGWAGVLLVLAGIVGFGQAAILFLDPQSVIAMAEQVYGREIPGIEAVVLAMAVFTALSGALSLIGGAFALMRRSYLVAVIGAIFGLFTMGFLMEGTAMSLIALLLLLTSKREFHR